MLGVLDCKIEKKNPMTWLVMVAVVYVIFWINNLVTLIHTIFGIQIA